MKDYILNRMTGEEAVKIFWKLLKLKAMLIRASQSLLRGYDDVSIDLNLESLRQIDAAIGDLIREFEHKNWTIESIISLGKKIDMNELDEDALITEVYHAFRTKQLCDKHGVIINDDGSIQISGQIDDSDIDNIGDQHSKSSDLCAALYGIPFDLYALLLINCFQLTRTSNAVSPTNVKREQKRRKRRKR